jgi:Flp pilus assembly protein TadG
MRFLKRFFAFRKSDRGSSLVELTVVVPFLAMFLVISVDFGAMYYKWLEVTNASHAGAEYASLFPSDSAGITAAAQQNYPNVTVLPPTYYCECSDGSSSSLNCATPPTSCTYNIVYKVQITTTEVYKTIIPWNLIPTPLFPHLAGPSTVTFSKTATIRSCYGTSPTCKG